MLQTYATATVICQTSGLKDPQSCQGLNSVLVAAPVKMNIASTSESEASVEVSYTWILCQRMAAKRSSCKESL